VARSYHVVLLDLEFHPRLVDTQWTGVDAIREMRERFPEVPVIVLSKTQDTTEITNALSAGAFHFIAKYFRLDEVVNLVEKAVETVRLQRRVEYVRTRDALEQGKLVYKSQVMQDVIKKVGRYAKSSLPILLTGETGTGKDLVAREIHQMSGRSGDFFVVNVNTGPEDLFDSEIMGHERGAFTGATASRPPGWAQQQEAIIGTDP
jgi:DNA-binding NtrC family response regulator